MYDKIPVRALSQEIISNRVVYGNFQDKHTPPSSLDYYVAVGEKEPFNDNILQAEVVLGGTTTDFDGHKGRGLYRYDYLNPDANTNLGWIHFAHDDMEPYVIERDSGTVDYTQSNDFVLLKQTTNDGTSYTVNLPSPSANEYRTIKFVSDNSVDSNDTVILDAGTGITIDSSQTYTIDRAFEGVTLFSDGSNWIIIQAKDK